MICQSFLSYLPTTHVAPGPNLPPWKPRSLSPTHLRLPQETLGIRGCPLSIALHTAEWLPLARFGLRIITKLELPRMEGRDADCRVLARLWPSPKPSHAMRGKKHSHARGAEGIQVPFKHNFQDFHAPFMRLWGISRVVRLGETTQPLQCTFIGGANV